MRCSFCNKDIKEKLSFKTIFEDNKGRSLCSECLKHLNINEIELVGYRLYYFADYDFLKDTIYKIKYFGDVRQVRKFKGLLTQFFSLNRFDLVITVPVNNTRKYIRGFDHIEQLCMLNNIEYKNILTTDYREKQARLHKKREEHKVYIKNIIELGNAKRVLIIDDVVTSGNTLLSCAKALENEFEEIEISFLVLARA